MTEAPPQQPKTVFGIDHIIDAAARRQKWIDQSQSVNLFLATPDMQGASARSNLNRTNRRAWDKGLKTTYYRHIKLNSLSSQLSRPMLFK